jgi:ferredoxin
MRIVHDPSACASLGMCEAVAPEVFEIGSDGALRVLNRAPDDGLRDVVEEAVEACPTGALRIEG